MSDTSPDYTARLGHLSKLGCRSILLTEIGGLAWLVAGLGGLCAAAGLVACCLRLRSLVEFALATYVLAWAGLVSLTLLLSPPRLVTRGWLVGGIALGLVTSVTVWLACGRPGAPRVRPGLLALREALRHPALVVLTLAVTLGLGYSVALALFTPVNEGDALAYHLARAGFWKQEHGLGYIANAAYAPLNGYPPNAEIGKLAALLLADNDRYVALPQFAAYAALVVSVAGIARRVGLGMSEALFGALAFATLPIVVLQASGALNDLVVASFLATAALFALTPGRAALVLFALALGLALGTKLTALIAIPTLALVVLAARPRATWLGLALASVVGLAFGSVWYAVNVVETGSLDGGVADALGQRAQRSPDALVVSVLRYALDLVDMSGAARPYPRAYVLAAGVLFLAGLWLLVQSRSRGIALIVAGALTTLPYFASNLVRVGQDAIVRVWAALGRPETPPFERGFNLNVEADPAASWFGPLGVLLLVVGTVAVIVLWRGANLPKATLGLAFAPWVLLLSLVATVVWDPFRGRFLVFGVALAASLWGVLLRFPVVAGATAAIGATTLALSLANYLGKPSGLDAVWPRTENTPAPLRSIWKDDRTEAQTRLRPPEGENAIFGYLERSLPDDAHVAVAARANDFLSPYFGARFSRNVSLVRPDGGHVSPDAEWLVVSPSSSVARCGSSWRRELELASGWLVERRIAPDTCPSSEAGS